MNNRMKAILHGRSEPEVLTQPPINLPHIPEPGKIDVHKQENKKAAKKIATKKKPKKGKNK